MKRFLLFIFKNDRFTAVFPLLGLGIIFLLCNYGVIGNGSNESLLDFAYFSSALIALLFQNCAITLKSIILSHLEDSLKLKQNSLKFVNAYEGDCITYSNINRESSLSLYKTRDCTSQMCKLPFVWDFFFDDKTIIITDFPFKAYKLPHEILPFSDELLKSHSTSSVYNRQCIRIDDWRANNDYIHIYTSRTTFFNSLITNRSLDYCLSCGITSRDLLDYGPQKRNLNNSQLSNHLGVSGMIESSDGYFVFIKKSKKNSISKRAYSCSVDSVFPILEHNATTKFCSDHIYDGIIEASKNELNIELEKAQIKLVAAYRNLIEGGKPQLLFYAKLDLDREDFEIKLKEKFHKPLFPHSNQSSANSISVKYRTSYKWVKESDLSKMVVGKNSIAFGSTYLPSTLSTAACVKMLLQSGII